MEEKRQEQSWEETESWNFSGGKGKQTGDDSKMAAWANRAERRAGVDRGRGHACGLWKANNKTDFSFSPGIL